MTEPAVVCPSCGMWHGVTEGEAANIAEHRSVVHLSPLKDSGIMPCCGRTPFEVPSTDRMTLEPEQVTCGRR